MTLQDVSIGSLIIAGAGSAPRRRDRAPKAHSRAAPNRPFDLTSEHSAQPLLAGSSALAAICPDSRREDRCSIEIPVTLTVPTTEIDSQRSPDKSLATVIAMSTEIVVIPVDGQQDVRVWTITKGVDESFTRCPSAAF